MITHGTTISKVAEGIQRLSVDATDLLFEGMWPVPQGVTMNSYILQGEKIAIVDGVCGWDGVSESLFDLLQELDISLWDIDYVIINHMEPDHSGWLDDFRKVRGDDFTVVTSEKAIPLLEAFYGSIPARIKVVRDGDTLDLGGRKLTFIAIPNVHWPETMATFDQATGTLMSCDAFGGFGAVGDSAYDGDLDEESLRQWEAEAERYYANIVATFSSPVLAAVKKVYGLGDRLRIVAPGHGLVWRKDPLRIVGDYQRYAMYQKGPAEKTVTVIWGSMYGNTEAAVPVAIEALEAAGLEVLEHRVPQTHVGEILASVWRSTGVLLAMPTYEYKMFPPMAAVLDELGKKRVQNRFALRLGSYGWSGGAQAELDEIMTRHRMLWNWGEPVEFKGRPKVEDLALVAERAGALAEAVLGAVKVN